MRLALRLLALLCLFAWATAGADFPVPTTFAFMTVTHTRGADYKNIEAHIQRYASLDCPIATELNIVWNNEIEPEKAPIKLNKSSWLRPVNFFKTPNNSMDWRYKIPQESKAEVYFNVDDDVNADCDELQAAFKKWQEHAVGSVGPIVTFAVRYFEYTQGDGFAYGRKKEANFFSLGLVGVSFLSRHFMQLYYAQIELLEEMRKIVKEKNNCDDIGMNWLIQYFYPELETIYFKTTKHGGNILAGSPKIAQSTSTTHYPYRSECIISFTKLFAINAIRYRPMDDDGRQEMRIKPMLKANVISKWKYLSAVIKGEDPKVLQDGGDSSEIGDQVKTTSELELRLQNEQDRAKKLQGENKKLSEKAKRVSQLEQSLQKEQSKSKALQGENKKLSEKITGAQNKQQDPHKVPLTEILWISLAALILLISFLIYKMIGLIQENKLLAFREEQGNSLSEVHSDGSH